MEPSSIGKLLTRARRALRDELNDTWTSRSLNADGTRARVTFRSQTGRCNRGRRDGSGRDGSEGLVQPR